MTNRQATPVYRVLLIGIDAYPSVPGKPIRQLGGCVADVDYLARTLGSLAIPEAAMTRLVAPRDRQSEESELPTRERILAALDALASEPIENTRTIVFYAGHGVHVRSSVTGAWSEGMVAADGQVIWDWELSPRFAAIHRNSESLTLLLDACGAAGLPRSGEVTEDALRARWVPLDELGPQVSSVTAAGSGDADRGLFSNDQMRGYTTMAAANRDELAYERNVGGVTLGIFTRALCMTLEQHRAELHARCADPLRWVDVENDLREHVQHALRDFKMEQTPQLLGPPNNRVLGGPPGAWCDAVPCVEVPGRAVPTYQISGGWMAGFEEDAIVELHRQLPDRPRVPQEDAAADEPTHELIVTASARPGSSEAKLRRAAPVALPPRGYARVIRPRALRVGLSAAVPAELQAALLERAEEDGLVYLPGMERGEASRAEQAEAYLGFDDNTVWLGDSLYGWDPVTTPGPLWQRSYAGSEARFIMGVRAVLRHAARFLIPIRSVRRAEREGFLSRNLALSVHRVVPGTPEQSVPKPANGRLALDRGGAYCFTVINRSYFNYYVQLYCMNREGQIAKINLNRKYVQYNSTTVLQESISLEPQKGGWDIERVVLVATQHREDHSSLDALLTNTSFCGCFEGKEAARAKGSATGGSAMSSQWQLVYLEFESR